MVRKSRPVKGELRDRQRLTYISGITGKEITRETLSGRKSVPGLSYSIYQVPGLENKMAARENTVALVATSGKAKGRALSQETSETGSGRWVKASSATCRTGTVVPGSKGATEGLSGGVRVKAV